MSPLNPEDPPRSADDNTASPFVKGWRRRAARVSAFDLRDQWWHFLDAWEAHAILRRTLYGSLALLVGGLAIWAWGYPWWIEHNSIRIAHQWLAAGQLRYAESAVEKALIEAPTRPEVWQLAAELARRENNPILAAERSRHAARLAPDDPTVVLEWATNALLASQTDEAERALKTLPVATLSESAVALRLAGEIARRRVQLTRARDYFKAALRLDGPGTAQDEVPLGTILIFSREALERRRGLGYLIRWSSDNAWGAITLRTLLTYALQQGDQSAMVRWAEALRAHPRCSLGDLPTCLLALSRADPARFATVLALLEEKHAANASEAALLIAWLNQIGRSAEAVQWIQILPAAITQKPPTVIVAAEAFRASGQWEKLKAWVDGGNWGTDTDFLRLIYGFEACRALGLSDRQGELWRTLQHNAQTNGVRALFAADALYAWGRQDEALTLLWLAADQRGVTVEALGTLARHYQVQHDGEGQYRVFRRLHSLRPNDAAIANNFAFFAALTGQDESAAEQIARANFAASPTNVVFRATLGFVFITERRSAEALKLLQPVAQTWPQSPAVALVYGLALAQTGRMDEAGPVLHSLEAATLTKQEVALIQKSAAR